MFIPVKIKYDGKKSLYFITIRPLKYKNDLRKVIKPDTKEITCIKKSAIFGNSNAIIEKMIANKKPMFYNYGRWKKAQAELSDDNLIVYSKYPLILDTVFEVKNSLSSSISKDYYVKSIKKADNLYINSLILHHN